METESYGNSPVEALVVPEIATLTLSTGPQTCTCSDRKRELRDNVTNKRRGNGPTAMQSK